MRAEKVQENCPVPRTVAMKKKTSSFLETDTIWLPIFAAYTFETHYFAALLLTKSNELHSFLR